MENLITVMGLICSVLGLLFTVSNFVLLILNYLKRKYCSKRKFFKLVKKLIPQLHSIQPDVILAPNKLGIKVALELTKNTFKDIPVYAVTVRDRKLHGVPGHVAISRKFYIDIPFSDISEYKSKTVLVVDDVYLTGNTIGVIKETLINNGFRCDKLFTAGLVTNSILMSTDLYPDISALCVDTDKYHFAWRNED